MRDCFGPERPRNDVKALVRDTKLDASLRLGVDFFLYRFMLTITHFVCFVYFVVKNFPLEGFPFILQARLEIQTDAH